MLHTRVCELLGIEHPIIQAGMAGSSTSAELVAAVSNAGGLGILGCLGRTADEAVVDIRRIRMLTNRPFGVNFVLHVRDEDTFAACLAERVPIFSFFRGDPGEVVPRAHAVGALTIHQITTTAEAAHACEAGVDLIIAQGHEAGGHNGPIPLNLLLPEVLKITGDRPVIAAGGLVDGHDLADMIKLGAAGILMGTRFLATDEAPISDAYKHAILAANGPDATIASGIFDLLWGTEWPGVTVRALQNSFTQRWVGHEDTLLEQRESALARFERANQEDNIAERGLLAGMGSSRISDIRPAGDIILEIVAEAERLLG